MKVFVVTIESDCKLDHFVGVYTNIPTYDDISSLFGQHIPDISFLSEREYKVIPEEEIKSELEQNRTWIEIMCPQTDYKSFVIRINQVELTDNWSEYYV